MLTVNKDILSRYNSMFTAIGKNIVCREPILRQIKFALVLREHLIMEGAPGVAKSKLALAVFKAISDADIFKIQCTKKMTEDHIVGPPNVRVLRDEGRILHNIEGTLVDSDYGFIDEMFDLSSGALRALLEILNERTFSRGAQRVRAPVRSVIATTNFNRADQEELAAVYDRFLFKASTSPLGRLSDRKLMLRAVANPTPVPSVTTEEIDYLSRKVDKVKTPTVVEDTYLRVCEGLPLTDRTVVKGLRVIKAAAVFRGSTIANVRDIASLDTCFVKTGDSSSERTFGSALAPYTSGLETQEKMGRCIIIASRINELQALANSAETYQDIHDVAVEAVNAQGALHAYSVKEVRTTALRAEQAAEDIIKRAETLFAETQGDTE